MRDEGSAAKFLKALPDPSSLVRIIQDRHRLAVIFKGE